MWLPPARSPTHLCTALFLRSCGRRDAPALPLLARHAPLVCMPAHAAHTCAPLCPPPPPAVAMVFPHFRCMRGMYHIMIGGFPVDQIAKCLLVGPAAAPKAICTRLWPCAPPVSASPACRLQTTPVQCGISWRLYCSAARFLVPHVSLPPGLSPADHASPVRHWLALPPRGLHGASLRAVSSP